MSLTTFQLRPLSDLFQVDKAQISKDESDYSKLQFIGLENIESHTKRYLTEFVSVPEGVCHRFNKNHVLYGKLRPYLNKIYLPDFEGKCSTEIVPLQPKNGYSREFISTILQSQTFIEEAVKHSTGGRMPRANLKHLLKLKVSVPEAEEANAIAHDLQAQLAHMQTMRESAVKQKDTAKALQSAILREVFPWQAGESLPSGWCWEKISKFATVIRGASPRPKGSPLFFGGSVPRLMVADVTRDGMYVTPKIDSLTEEGAKRSRSMKAGSLVIQVSGNPGTPTILKIDCCIHDGFAGLIGVDENKYYIPYIYFYLETVKNISSKGASGGIWENLDTNKIRGLSIPFPETREQQEEIVNRIFEKMEHATKLLNSCNKQLATIDVLPAAILRETFNFEINEN